MKIPHCLLFVLSVVIAGCGGGPLAPSGQPVTVIPAEARMSIGGGELVLLATGGDGKKYEWQAPPGLIMAAALEPSRTVVRSAGTAGDYQVKVTSGGNSAVSTIHVMDQNWLELVSITPASGCRLGVGTFAQVRVNYVTLVMPIYIDADLRKADGGHLLTRSSQAGVRAFSGVQDISVTASEPGESTEIVIEMGSFAGYRTLTSIKVPWRCQWV